MFDNLFRSKKSKEQADKNLVSLLYSSYKIGVYFNQTNPNLTDDQIDKAAKSYAINILQKLNKDD